MVTQNFLKIEIGLSLICQHIFEILFPWFITIFWVFKHFRLNLGKMLNKGRNDAVDLCYCFCKDILYIISIEIWFTPPGKLLQYLLLYIFTLHILSKTSLKRFNKNIIINSDWATLTGLNYIFLLKN